MCERDFSIAITPNMQRGVVAAIDTLEKHGWKVTSSCEDASGIFAIYYIPAKPQDSDLTGDKQENDNLTKGTWGVCRCGCHSNPNMKHCMPCCSPCSVCGLNIAGDMNAHMLWHKKTK